MPGAAQFVTALAARGRHHFTTDEAVAELGDSVEAVRAALRRLKKKGEIASPHRGFHVIVPPEYRSLGCLPADQFVPQLMEHLGEYYYVGLLSAAELHGAAHQRPQGFQVMLRASRRPTQCGRVRVEWIGRKDLVDTPVVRVNTPRGELRVASPEATALELVGYADRCGGLDVVASVLAELADPLDDAKLLEAAMGSPVAWVQRLGYLLERVDQGARAEVLVPLVEAKARAVAPLVRARVKTGAERSERWKLAINATVDADT